MNKILKFIREARQELKKVNWPSRKELIESTKVVIISSLLMILFIGLADWVYSKLIKILFEG
jgi:preprotein translocase subunit SecE